MLINCFKVLILIGFYLRSLLIGGAVCLFTLACGEDLMELGEFGESVDARIKRFPQFSHFPGGDYSPAPPAPYSPQPYAPPKSYEPTSYSPPAPAYHEPAPYSLPAPAYHEPAPYNPPAPAYHEPSPYSPPSPAYHEPAPYSPPAPAYHEPAPYSPAAPAYHAPAPYDAPAPAHHEPAPYHAPAPAYHEPAPYHAPAPGYQEHEPYHDEHHGVPGVPCKDYPCYAEAPYTKFTCASVPFQPGMYADPESGCQVFISTFYSMYMYICTPVCSTFVHSLQCALKMRYMKAQIPVFISFISY